MPLTVSLLAGFSCHIPDNLVDLVVFKLVKDAIRSDQSIVEIVNTALLMCGLWLAGDNASHPTQVQKLRLAIAKSPADGEAAWEYSVGSNEWVLLLIAVLLLRQYLLPHLLRRSRRHAVLHDGLRLVNIATGCLDAIEFSLI